MKHPFPPNFISTEAHLSDVFIEEATRLGSSALNAERLFMILPKDVKSAPAIKFTLSPGWCYYYGEPFRLSGSSTAVGIPYQAPLVVNLVRASIVADSVLTPMQLLNSWLPQVNNPAKHLDAISEMLAVAFVNPDQHLTYEPVGLGVGSHRIDWLLTTKSEGEYLLEIKNRTGQLAQEIRRIQPQMSTGIKTVPGEPNTDFDALFKSTYIKFHPVSGSTRTQGVAIFPSIKIPSGRFGIYFRNRLQANLHFVALVNKEGTHVDILAISSEIKSQVLISFGWSEGANLLY
jgi:hypothetical protein